jgi:hypothetical protein
MDSLLIMAESLEKIASSLEIMSGKVKKLEDFKESESVGKSSPSGDLLFGDICNKVNDSHSAAFKGLAQYTRNIDNLIQNK